MQSRAKHARPRRSEVPAIPIDSDHLATIDLLAKANGLYTSTRNGAEGSTRARPHRRAAIAGIVERLRSMPEAEAVLFLRDGLALYGARMALEGKPGLRFAEPPGDV
jgi:hypothetical protein